MKRAKLEKLRECHKSWYQNFCMLKLRSSLILISIRSF